MKRKDVIVVAKEEVIKKVYIPEGLRKAYHITVKNGKVYLRRKGK